MQALIRSSSELSAHLRTLRKAKGWTQAELAEKLGVTQARVAQIEAHPGCNSVTRLVQMLHLLEAHILIYF